VMLVLVLVAQLLTNLDLLIQGLICLGISFSCDSKEVPVGQTCA